MKTVTTLAFTFALLAFGSSASAAAVESTSQVIKHDAPKGISATFYACVDKNSDTVSQATCLGNEKDLQDKRLNTTYKALLAKLDANAKQKLIDAERAWVDLQTKSGVLETALYGNEQVADLQLEQNAMFRICERANALENYLSLVNDK